MFSKKKKTIWIYAWEDAYVYFVCSKNVVRWFDKCHQSWNSSESFLGFECDEKQTKKEKHEVSTISADGNGMKREREVKQIYNKQLVLDGNYEWE